MIHNLAADVTAFTSNAFLVEGERTVLVDAGANFDVVARLRERDVVPDLDAIFVTHTHRDHVENVPDVRAAADVETWGYDAASEHVDNAVADGETVRIGDRDYRALHTPGHKRDHLCFYSESASVCFAGDLAFANGGFGRTDLEEGDPPALLDSLEYLLEVVDGDLAELHAGHGSSVTDGAAEHVELALRTARLELDP